jgi:UDP:flavonoid glycosyltransferase YjiC (YdhE family)
MPAVVVMGPNYRPAGSGNAGVRRIGSATIEQMSDLMDGAALVLSGGGSLMLQALALRRPCIAVPLTGDQERRVADFAKAGCVVAAPLDAQRLARAIARALTEAPVRASLERGVAACGLRNGVPTLVDALARLAEAG